MSLTKRQRLRRVGILCCNALRNMAFYLAWVDAGRPRATEQFWITATSNFADIVVLEWCKLFCDRRGAQRWSKVVTDQERFLAGLLQAASTSTEGLEEYIDSMRYLRDKFVAHLDEELEMTLPFLIVAKNSTIYLYDYLLEQEDGGGVFEDAPHDAREFYDRYHAEASALYTAPLAEHLNPI